MAEYVIISDSGSDINKPVFDEWGVKATDLTFHFEDGIEHSNSDMAPAEFYKRMRDGEVSKTAAINIETFKDLFRPELEAGKDILYLGFSSGISSTSHSGIMAGKELEEEFPDRKIITIDTLGASAGEGLIVYLAVENKKKGASIEENAQYVRQLMPKLAQWFTVDDLKYLVRGGRVSAAAAFAAGMLGIKPVLHVDDEGCLINMMKVRGRSQSIKALAKKYSETADDPANGVYFISHADCMEDALELERLIEKAHGCKCRHITDVGPVIGSHSGPGTLALFYIGSSRN